MNTVRLHLVCAFAILIAALTTVPAYAAATPLKLSLDGTTWTTGLSRNPLYGSTGQELLQQGDAWTVIGQAPASPSDYRIHPGAGLRGNFYARNDSNEPARLGIFAHTVTTDTAEKPDPLTPDDFVLRLRMNGTGWEGPASVEAHAGCVVAGQRVIQPGEVILVSLDAIIAYSTRMGTSGQLTLTMPEISVALTAENGSGPYTVCQRSDPEEPTPPPGPAPTVKPTPPVRPTNPTDRGSDLRRGGFADTGLYDIVTTYPWVLGMTFAGPLLWVILWRRSRRD